MAAFGTPAAMAVYAWRAEEGTACDKGADALPWLVAARHGLRIPTVTSSSISSSKYVDETFSFELGLRESSCFKPLVPLNKKQQHMHPELLRAPNHCNPRPEAALRKNSSSAEHVSIESGCRARERPPGETRGSIVGPGGLGSCAPLFRVTRFHRMLRNVVNVSAVTSVVTSLNARGGRRFFTLHCSLTLHEPLI